MPTGIYPRVIGVNTGLVKGKHWKIKDTSKMKGHSHPRWNKGLSLGKEEKSTGWKGDKIKYSGLHKWVNRRLGKAKKCEFCGKEGTGKKIQWANIDHKYRRVLTDWLSLCVPCHRKYDFKLKEDINSVLRDL